MGRISWLPFSGTLTNANGDYDLIEVTPADDKPIVIRGLILGQITEIGDAQEEQLDLRLIRMTATVTSGTGGAAGAPFCPDTADSVSYTSETMNTGVATTTGSTHEIPIPWNLRAAPLEIWFPEARYGLKAKGLEYLFLRLSTAVVDDVGIKGAVCIEEE